ncbi:uncharacterized protein LOC121000997 [Bufo bufo]|uniref:uncharacterized protein LOC121000997 n=1 Tax=Bufo bufo TaxID=8384 RepID=UPI001ABDD2CA|nr:uncharacterized protein LOC121000997 [Bufo bufo]
MGNGVGKDLDGEPETRPTPLHFVSGTCGISVTDPFWVNICDRSQQLCITQISDVGPRNEGDWEEVKKMVGLHPKYNYPVGAWDEDYMKTCFKKWEKALKEYRKRFPPTHHIYLKQDRGTMSKREEVPWSEILPSLPENPPAYDVTVLEPQKATLPAVSTEDMLQDPYDKVPCPKQATAPELLLFSGENQRRTGLYPDLGDRDSLLSTAVIVAAALMEQADVTPQVKQAQEKRNEYRESMDIYVHDLIQLRDKLKTDIVYIKQLPLHDVFPVIYNHEDPDDTDLPSEQQMDELKGILGGECGRTRAVTNKKKQLLTEIEKLRQEYWRVKKDWETRSYKCDKSERTLCKRRLSSYGKQPSRQSSKNGSQERHEKGK